MSRGRPRIAVVRFPGMNCEEETRRAVVSRGMDSDIVMWNAPPDDLASYDGFVLPGGFSYQDRVRAGSIAAKDRVVDCLFEQAQAGKPVIGICNGCQILVESGMVPGLEPGRVEMGVATNIMPDRDGYYTRWVHMLVSADIGRSCATLTLGRGDVIASPIAHAEGRFVTSQEGLLDRLTENGQILMRYSTHDGRVGDTFAVNPNGSSLSIAAICNPRGNVVAMMPHPERATWLYQVPDTLAGKWGERKRASAGEVQMLKEAGPGAHVLDSLREFIERGPA